MDCCDGDAALAFTLDSMRGVACFGVRQQRAEEAFSEVEAVKRWLADGNKLNFQKTWRSNVDASQSDTLWWYTSVDDTMDRCDYVD